jgi:RNA polymerase sigma factor (sigma-70 family)
MAQPVLPDLDPPVTSNDAILQKWDRHIRLAARRAAFAVGGDADDANDLAQLARIRLARALDRTSAPLPNRYIRKVIGRAVLNALRDDQRTLTAHSPSVRRLDDDFELADRSDRPDHEALKAVRIWARTLPSSFKSIYDLLYGSGSTQREAAAALGISQPRVAQLHRSLVERGRRDLSRFAA